MLPEIGLFLVGICVGIMNAVAGGGMLVGFPILLAFGLSPLVANATGNIVTAPGQLASALGYRQYLKKIPFKYALLLIPIIFGSLGGSLTLRNTSPQHFEKMVPLLVLFGVLLFTFQPLLHFHLHTHLKGRAKSLSPLVLIGLAMLPVSFYGGYFGAGYGFMMLAFLGMTNLHDTHMMNAMKNVSAVFVSGISVICLFSAHLIDWHFGLIMAAGTVTGGYVGARSAQKLSSHWLRIIVIVVGVGAVVYLGFKEY